MSSIAPPTPPPRRRRWNPWVVLGCIFAAALLLPAFALLFEDGRADRAWERFVAEARAKEVPMEVQQITPPPVPDEENLAMIPLLRSLTDYTRTPGTPGNPAGDIVWRDPQLKERVKQLKPAVNEASAGKLPANWRRGEFRDLRDLLPKPAKGLPQTASENAPQALLDVLAQFEPELNQIRAAMGRPYTQFPFKFEDGIFAPLEPATVCLGIARLCQQRAVAELALGNSRAAADDILLGDRLISGVVEQPVLIYHLVAIASLEVLMPPIWEGLARHQWQEAELARFERILAQIDLVKGFQVAMHAERLLGAWPMIERLREHPEQFNQLTAGGFGAPSNASLAFRLVPNSAFTFNKIHTGEYLIRLAESVDPSQHRYFPDRAKSIEHEVQSQRGNVPNPYRILAQLLVPSLSTAHGKSASGQATVDLARCAIALERYRLKEGKYPETLAALTPSYLQAPTDVITGEPIHYMRAGDDTYRLYSVGANAVDDGGIQQWKGARPDFDSGDWCWPQPKEASTAPK